MWHYLLGHRSAYNVAIVYEVDMERMRILRSLHFSNPSDVCYCKAYSLTFKAGHIEDNLLYVPTQSEIFIYNLNEWRLVNRKSSSLFNDLHHVTLVDKKLFVANTGLDSVAQLEPDGFTKLFPVMNEDLTARFDLKKDYRSISTKPHKSHPNYIFQADGDIWVTRFRQKDAITLNGRKRIHVRVGLPHDGIVVDDRIYFTTVNGFIVVADPSTCLVDDVINLNDLFPGELLGWCRGLLIEDEVAYVGVTMIRHTKQKENIAWLAENGKSLPTMILKIDLRDKKLLARMTFSQRRLSAIFSILRRPK